MSQSGIVFSADTVAALESRIRGLGTEGALLVTRVNCWGLAGLWPDPTAWGGGALG